MEVNKIKACIIKALEQRRPIKKIYKKNIDNFAFLASGHIDSLELIKFNFFLEKKFKIKFSPKDFIKKEFQTISGLSKIIKKKISSKSK